jgi:hypothetical protein
LATHSSPGRLKSSTDDPPVPGFRLTAKITLRDDVLNTVRHRDASDPPGTWV